MKKTAFEQILEMTMTQRADSSQTMEEKVIFYFRSAPFNVFTL